MIRHLLALTGALILHAYATPAGAQLVTVTAPLPDSNRDGKTTVQALAAKLGVPKGTVLTRCGTTLVYVGPKSACPAAPAVAEAKPVNLVTIAAPVITKPARDYGSSGQCMYLPAAPGTYGDFRASRALDCVLMWSVGAGPRLVQDFVIDQARVGVTTQPKSGAFPKIEGVTLRRFDVTARKWGVRVRGASSLLLEDFRIRGVGINTATGDIPVGVGVDGGHVVLRRGEIGGFKSDYGPGRYSNADCVSAERGDTLDASDLYLHDCTDGAVDTKAVTRLDRITAENISHRSFRFWADVTAGSLTSINPGWAHIWAGKTARVTIAKLTAVGPMTLVDTEAGATVSILACDLTHWTGKTLVKGQGKVTLGAGCVARP